MDYREIEEFIEKGSSKLSLKNGEVYRVRFISAEVVTGKFGKQVAIELVDLSDGEKKKLYTASQRLLRSLFHDLKVKPDDELYLRKTGDRFETVYEVRRVNKGDEVVSADDIKEKKKKLADSKDIKSSSGEINLDEIDL